VTVNSVMSVCPHWTTGLPTDRFSWNLSIFQKLCQGKSDMNNKYLHRDLCTFMTISHRILLRMWNVSDKSCRKNQNTHCTFNNTFFLKCSIYEIMWKNTAQPDRSQMTT
jgi:hypothetical protein